MSGGDETGWREGGEGRGWRWRAERVNERRGRDWVEGGRGGGGERRG